MARNQLARCVLPRMLGILFALAADPKLLAAADPEPRKGGSSFLQAKARNATADDYVPLTVDLDKANVSGQLMRQHGTPAMETSAREGEAANERQRFREATEGGGDERRDDELPFDGTNDSSVISGSATNGFGTNQATGGSSVTHDAVTKQDNGTTGTGGLKQANTKDEDMTGNGGYKHVNTTQDDGVETVVFKDDKNNKSAFVPKGLVKTVVSKGPADAEHQDVLDLASSTNSPDQDSIPSLGHPNSITTNSTGTSEDSDYDPYGLHPANSLKSTEKIIPDLTRASDITEEEKIIPDLTLANEITEEDSVDSFPLLPHSVSTYTQDEGHHHERPNGSSSGSSANTSQGKGRNAQSASIVAPE